MFVSMYVFMCVYMLWADSGGFTCPNRSQVVDASCNCACLPQWSGCSATCTYVSMCDCLADRVCPKHVYLFFILHYLHSFRRYCLPTSRLQCSRQLWLGRCKTRVYLDAYVCMYVYRALIHLLKWQTATVVARRTRKQVQRSKCNQRLSAYANTSGRKVHVYLSVLGWIKKNIS